MQKAKVYPMILGLAGAVAFLATLVGGAAFVYNQTLLAQVESLRQERQEAWGEVQAARDRQAAAERMLEERLERVASLESQMAELRDRVERSGELAMEDRRALRGQVYAGRQSLGEGWVLVGGKGTNGVLGPVVMLDERVLRNLVRSAAEEWMSEQPSREVTVNHNYGTVPYAYPTWWPVAWVRQPGIHPTNRPPSGIKPPAITLPPADVRSGREGIWRPTEKPFLPSPSPWPGVTPQRSQPVFRAGVQTPRPTLSQPAQPVTLPRGGSVGSFAR